MATTTTGCTCSLAKWPRCTWSDGAACRYWAEVLAAGRAIRARFSPVKMNYLTLGNTVPHLHTHVLPRYLDDPAPGGPVPWPEIFSPDPAPDAELHEQAAGLRVLLAR